MTPWLADDRGATRWLVLVGVALVTLGYFVAEVVGERHQQAQAYARGVGVTREALHAGDLVHQLQAERGLTGGYLASRAAPAATEALARQRPLTDAALDTYRALADAEDAGPNKALEALARGLAEQRSRVDALALEPPAAAGWYTARVEALAAEVLQLARFAPDADASRQIASYFYLVSAKEHYGRERGLVNAVLGSGKPLGEQGLRNLQAITVRQAAFEALLRATADPPDIALFDQALQSKESAAVVDMRNAVTELASRGDYPVPAAQWWAQASARMEAVKRVEDRIAARLLASAQARADERLRDFRLAAVLGLLAAAASAALAWRLVTGLPGAGQRRAAARRVSGPAPAATAAASRTAPPA
ncbi:nitrate- and nitrite sensing domain-containing protein [Ramlibacter sp. MAHUQ-53]|uniref:nitrate- and nitrite sensing domain-containing protein n=1 Tax=unclassified Ramlibacter TaxID=2617605 RepID=UPI0036332E07